MSSSAQSLVTWEEFLRLPERPETGQRYELQDGEVVIGPPAWPLHIKLEKRSRRSLTSLRPTGTHSLQTRTQSMLRR